MTCHLTLVRQPQKLPVVLTLEEVAQLIEAAPGPKYKAARCRLRGRSARVGGCQPACVRHRLRAHGEPTRSAHLTRSGQGQADLRRRQPCPVRLWRSRTSSAITAPLGVAPDGPDARGSDRDGAVIRNPSQRETRTIFGTSPGSSPLKLHFRRVRAEGAARAAFGVSCRQRGHALISALDRCGHRLCAAAVETMLICTGGRSTPVPTATMSRTLIRSPRRRGRAA